LLRTDDDNTGVCPDNRLHDLNQQPSSIPSFRPSPRDSLRNISRRRLVPRCMRIEHDQDIISHSRPGRFRHNSVNDRSGASAKPRNDDRGDYRHHCEGVDYLG
jgi:hypothetical protein